MGAGRREDPLHAAAGIGRTADHLDLRFAGVDDADPQTVSIRVLPSLFDIGDLEGRQGGGPVLQILDLQADHGELLDDLLETGFCLQMILEPGKGEFHHYSPLTRLGASKGTKP